MKTKTLLINLSMSIVIILVAISCNSEEKEDFKKGIQASEKSEISLSPSTRSVANNLRDFYFRFTTDMAKYVDADARIDSKNVIASPISTSMTLGMIANGLNQESQNEICGYLGVDDLKSLNDLCKTLVSELPKADNTATFNLANSIWTASDHHLTDSFSSISSDFFNAYINHQNFSDNPTKAKDAINTWCSQHTQGIIPHFIDNIDPATIISLMNAICFNAPWHSNPFMEENTTTSLFHGSKGDSKVRMMKSNESDRFVAADDDFEYFFLPLGNSAFNIHFLVPNKDISLEEATQKVSIDRFSSLIKKAVLCPLTVHLPKFKLEGKYDITDVLSAAGLSILQNNPELPMFENPVSGSIVFNQAASFSIDESGVTAAAVTSGDIVNTLLPTEGQPYTVTVDHPFFFFITEFSTGACILSGRIADL
ncbi:MAG: hypothetical protein K2M27_09680 [Muribaculaceae bacterium]|nr:hypothetical protein [Muribaculaceae bacterium]